MKGARTTIWLAVRLLAFSFALLFPSRAHAYSWMIRHGYTGCTPCHTDPSGAGPLSAYGRAQSELLLRAPYGEPSDEAGPTAGFLWGAIPLPDEVRLGGDFRGAFLSSKLGEAPIDQRLILMRSDLYGDAKLWRMRVAASLGFSPTGALNAALTDNTTDNLISREHWLGFELDEDAAWLVRAGRMALPFGIRNVEHTLWVRNLTRTDLLDNQQYGAALSVSKDWGRAELMAILGNYQLHPDDYRERGYSAYVELAPTTHLAVGASSLFTRARRDIYFRVTDYRQAHGLFFRYSPAMPLVFLAEADWLYQSLTHNGHRAGYAGFAQADWEPSQGVHFMLTGETKNEGSPGEPSSYGAWFSSVWFFARHADVRFDSIYQRLNSSFDSVDSLSLLVQLHVFL